MIRELFVELGDAVMDALRAQVEQTKGVSDPSSLAHAHKQAYAPYRKTWVDAVLSRTSTLGLASIHDWRWCDAYRAESSATIVLDAMHRCGHGQRYLLAEKDLRACAEADDVLDLIDRVIERRGAPCYCVQRPK